MARLFTRYQHIKDLREDADLTQSELAKILNCSQVSYSYYEIGRRDIPTDILIRLAEYYNCSVDYLLGLTQNKERNE
ncbi:MAG: helix-turn-helix transcriptional regulator [Lachnospiraceae bacterium]|nr:helix-turn-helix transcriptional regulator [Lachnospiraceae bacterium]